VNYTVWESVNKWSWPCFPRNS